MDKALFVRLLRFLGAFVGIAMGLDIFGKLIYSKFNVDQIFTNSYFYYEFLLESFIILGVGLATFFLSRLMRSDNLGIALLKTLFFGVCYAFSALIYTHLTVLILGTAEGITFGLYETFLVYIPKGIEYGILFLLIFHYLDPQSGNTEDTGA